MDRREAIEWLKDIKESEVLTDWSYDVALDLAIEALKGDLHCPKCGTIVRDGRQYHDLVYRGKAEQVTGKLKNPDDSLLKPDSDECKEQKSKLDCISRQQAIEVLHKYFIDAIDKTPHEIDEDGDDVYTNMKAVNELLKHNKHISKAIKALPPVTPTDKVVDFNNMISADDRIRNLPPVTPQVKVQQADTLIIATALRDFAQDSERNISDRERAEELREQVLAYGASMCHVTPTERTGEWEEVQGCKSYLCCSECGRFVNVAHKCNFCPNCGADMRGDTE